MPDTWHHDALASDLRRVLAEAAVRPSLLRCCERFEEFFDLFYATLADKAPGVGAMFANVDMSRQNTLVHDGIVRLLDFATGDTFSATELQRLGRLHARDRLDIDPELYPIWVDSLLLTIREFDGRFSEPLGEAWRAVLAPGIAVIVSLYDVPSTPSRS